MSETMTPKIQLLQGPLIEKALDEKALKVFRYQLNPPVINALKVLCGLFLLAAAALWYWLRFSSGLWSALIIVLIVLGAFAGGLVSQFYHKVNNHFVAASDEYLFIGSNQRLWRIAWSLLDRHALGFDNMELTSVKGWLDIRVAGEKIRLQVFNAFIHIKDVHGLMLCLLEHLQDNEGVDEPSNPQEN